MKVSKMWSCLLLLGALFNFSGCDQIVKIFSGGSPHTPTKTPVSINGCAVATANDPIIEHSGTPVTWTFSDNSYVITFNPKYDKTSKKDITPPPSSITHTSTTAGWDNANTPIDCGDNGGGCYFKYNIYGGDKQLCKDPGIHIIP